MCVKRDGSEFGWNQSRERKERAEKRGKETEEGWERDGGRVGKGRRKGGKGTEEGCKGKVLRRREAAGVTTSQGFRQRRFLLNHDYVILHTPMRALKDGTCAFKERTCRTGRQPPAPRFEGRMKNVGRNENG